MKNILSFVNKPISGKTIKQWILFHVVNQTKYTKVARTMTRYMNLIDGRQYRVELRPVGTGCGERKIHKPNIRKFEQSQSKMPVLTKNISRHPYTGVRIVNGQLKLSTKPWLNNYYNWAPDSNWINVTGVTRGKIYNVVGVEGLGDCENVIFIDDNNELHVLADFFFEEV